MSSSTTQLVVLHVPSRRSRQWQDFLLRIWQCCLVRPCRCLAVLHVHDEFGADLLAAASSLSLSVGDCVSSAGFSSQRPPFRRRLLSCHFGTDFPVFCRLPVGSVLQPGILPRLWISSLVSTLAADLELDVLPSDMVVAERAGAHNQGRRSKLSPLVSEFAEVVSVPAREGWQVRDEVELHGQFGKILELRSSMGDSGAQQLVAKIGLWRDPVGFVREACSLPHPFDEYPSVPDHVRRTVFERLTMGKAEFARSQLNALQSLQQLEHSLQDEEESLKASMHPMVHSVLGGKPIVLFKTLCERTGWDDSDLYKHVSEGFPLVGHMSFTGLFEARTRPASLTIEQLKKQSTWLKRAALGSCSSSGDEWTDKELWSTVLKDIENGWADGPFYSEQEVTAALGGDSQWVPSRRFPVVQNLGTKVRGVDDLSASLVNSTVTTYEKLVPGSADRIASLIAFMSVVGAMEDISIPLGSGEVLRGVRHPDFRDPSSRRIMGMTIDLSSAYRQLAYRPDHAWACVLVAYDPGLMKPAYVLLKALPFGASAAVEAFLRTSLAIKHIGQHACKLTWECFFDDFPVVDFAPLAETSRLAALGLFKRLDWKVSADKMVPMSGKFLALGVVFDCCQAHLGTLVIGNKDGRIDDICASLRDVIAGGTLGLKRLQKLRGKLGFATMQTHGRWPSLLLSSLSGVLSEDECEPLSRSMFETLRWFLTFLPAMPSRSLQLTPSSKPLLLFTDGAFEGGHASVGMVLLNPSLARAWWAGSVVPPSWLEYWKLHGVEHPICEIELLALICGLSLWSSDLERQRCLTFVDNNASLDAVIRNKSSSGPMRHLLCLLADLDSRVQWMSWYGRVPSHSNVADAPSRGTVPVLPNGWLLTECQFLWDSLPEPELPAGVMDLS